MEQIKSNVVFQDSQKLPDDLIRIICLIAAEKDQDSAYALALTCQKICRWTANARIQTVHIGSIKQMISFWQIINRLPCSVSDTFCDLYDLDLSEGSEEDWQRILPSIRKAHEFLSKSRQDRAFGTLNGISFPSGSQPHTHVKNLFVDVESLADVSERLKIKNFRKACKYFDRHFDKISPFHILERWENDENARLECVSLGYSETHIYRNLTLSRVSIRELTLISAHETFWVEFAWPNWLPRNLERLHLIGYDEEFPLSGITPPFNAFRDLPILYLDDLDSVSCKVPPNRKLTHIRFDTPRFSLKPTEITARRLGPLLHELTLSTPSSLSFQGDSDRSATSSYQFNGSRFAAPAPGSGSYDRPQSENQMNAIHKLAQKGDKVAQHMFDIGVGRLMFFQLAWEPMIDSKSKLFSTKPWYHVVSNEKSNEEKDKNYGAKEGNGQVSTASSHDSGGWPRERRGAWAERAEKVAVPNAFAIELRDAIDDHWGWYEEGIEPAGKYCREIEREKMEGIERPLYERNSTFKSNQSPKFFDDFESNSKHHLEIISVSKSIKNNVTDWQETHPQFASVDLDGLCYGIRCPKSLIHLGGKATFTYYDRLYTFLDRAHGGKGPWP